MGRNGEDVEDEGERDTGQPLRDIAAFDMVIKIEWTLHDLWSQDADTPTRADTTSDGDITAHAVHGIPSKRRLSVWPVWMKDIVGVREEYLGSWVDQPVCDGGGGDERKDGKGTH